MYCPNCMRYNNNENAVRCQYCNEPLNVQNNTFQLPVGTILAGRYYVGKVLGQGGFGITYIGCDLKLNMKMAIKEYYPQGLIGRVSKYDLNLTVNSGNQHTVYEIQKDRFMKEARILAEFASDIRIVRVTDIFEENNTAYIVMEYVEGVTLENYCKQYGRMSFDAIWDMLHPLVETLEKIHVRGLIHRDISPSNIMLNNSTGIKLIDFGSARDYSTTDDKSLSVVLKPGYAPPEQYSSHGQGPWTDVYALCATIYRVITGVVPENAYDRIANDGLRKPSELGAAIKHEQEAVIMQGLSVKKKERVQSMKELYTSIENAEHKMVERLLVHNATSNNKQSLNNHNNNELLSAYNDSVDIKNEEKDLYQSERQKTDNNIDLNTPQLKENKYQNAVNLMRISIGISEYEEAISVFNELGNYKDARNLINECQDKIDCLKEEKKKIEMYQNAVAVKNSAIGIGGYEVAISKLNELGDYKDVQKLIAECQHEIDYINEEKRKEDFRRREKENFNNKIKILAGIIIAAAVICTVLYRTTDVISDKGFMVIISISLLFLIFMFALSLLFVNIRN